MMGRIWNFIGWMTITLIVPALIFASICDFEGDSSALIHSAGCKACCDYKIGHELPSVIDGDNLRVIVPARSTVTAAGRPVAHRL
jgi:hypothetical protein